MEKKIKEIQAPAGPPAQNFHAASRSRVLHVCQRETKGRVGAYAYRIIVRRLLRGEGERGVLWCHLWCHVVTAVSCIDTAVNLSYEVVSYTHTTLSKTMIPAGWREAKRLPPVARVALCDYPLLFTLASPSMRLV